MLRFPRKLFFFLPFLFMSFSTLGKSLENYEYDATGNIVSIKQSDQSLAIYSFSPTFGQVGAIVAIHGNLFSGVLEQDAVSFNGTSASILSATESELIVRVPQGATTGLVSVTVQGNTASSENDFVVTEDGGGPVIYDFWPKCGAAGTTVTVRGDGFDLAPAATQAGIGTNTVISNIFNTSELTFSVPANSSTSYVRVTTPLGVGISSDAFFIPPAGSGLTCANTVRSENTLLVDDEAKQYSFEANQKRAIFFHAEENDLLTLQLSEKATLPTTTAIHYAVYGPNGASVTNASINSNLELVHLPFITTSGIYTIVLSAVNNISGHVKIKLERDPLIHVDGDVVVFNTEIPGQSKRIGFWAEENQSLGFGISEFSYGDPSSAWRSFNIALQSADGRFYSSNPYTGSSETCYQQYGQCDLSLPIIKQTGLYAVVLKPQTTHSFVATAHLSNNKQATLQKGQDYLLSIDDPGQDGWLSFEGLSGENTDVVLSGFNSTPVNSSLKLYVFKPDGSLQKNTTISVAGGRLTLGTLPTSGLYRIWVSPYYGATSEVTITLQ